MLCLGHDRQANTRNDRIGDGRNIQAQITWQTVTAQRRRWEDPSADQDIGLSIQAVDEIASHDIPAKLQEMANLV